MTDKIESYETLFKQAEELWDKIATRASHEFKLMATEAGYEILMEIANGKTVVWDDEIKRLAKALKHQGDVVSALDELVLSERDRRNAKVGRKQ